MENTIKSRLKFYLSATNKSVNSLSSSTTEQVRFNRQINQDSALTADTLATVAEQCSQLSAEWLLRGDGEMLLSECNSEPTQVEKALRRELAVLRTLLDEKESHLQDLREMMNLKKVDSCVSTEKRVVV